MGIKIQKKTATATVTKVDPNKMETMTTEKVPLKTDPETGEIAPVSSIAKADTIASEVAPCIVGMEASYTHNLGNYQSARVAVTLQVPCPHDEIDSVFEFAKSWVNDRLEAMTDELVNGSEG